MKWFMVSVLACFVAHEATAQQFLRGMGVPGLGYGNDILGLNTGMGMGGVGGGLGLGNRFMNRLGYGGLGGVSSGSGYSQGGGYGDNQYNSGATGLANQGMHSNGMGNYHDIGQHHSSLSSITQAENTDNHNIGGGQAFDTGLQSGNLFNQFGNGGSRYGSGYGSGQESMNSFI